MKDQESNENWQLEEGNQVDDRWVLRESEQQLNDQWELNQADEEEPIRDWQPVEYNRPERSGLAWVVPVVITVFLLVLIGYSGFILLPQIINPTDPDSVAVTDTATPTPEGEGIAPAEMTPVDEAGEDGTTPAVPAADTPAPTPNEATAPDESGADSEDGDNEAGTPVLPAPTQSLEPTTIEQNFATVITTYGVNARLQPDPDGEVLRILNQGESFFLFGAPAEGWLEILVADEDVELVQGQPIEGEIAYAAAEFFDVETQPILRSFYEDIMTFAGRTPELPDSPDTDTPIVGLPTPTPGPDGDATSDDETGTDTATPATTPEPVTARIDSPAGLNVRTTPDTTGEIISLLPEGAVVPALDISDDEQWVQVQLEDGAVGWIFSEFITVDGDLNTLANRPSAPAAAPGVIDATQVITSGIVPPAPFSAIIPGDTPAVVIAVAAGAIARVEPAATAQELTLLPQGAALPAINRTADGQWIEVELPEGNLTGWISRSVVSVTTDIDTLPIEGVVADADDADTDDSDTGSTILLPTPTPGATGGDTSTGTGTGTGTTPEAQATVRDILLTVYPEPSATGNSVAMLPRGTVVPVSGRNDDADWVLIETEDGDAGWVAVRSVILSVSVNTLPVVEP